MKKIVKTLLFVSLIMLLAGVVCAAEAQDNTNDATSDATVTEKTGTVAQGDTVTQKNMKEVKADESTAKTIRKKGITNSNVKKDNQITVSSWEQLSSNITALTSGSGDTTIRLNKSTYINTGTITWETKGIILTIDGNGQTINGNQQQVFNISRGCSLVLKNITIINCQSDSGGAIYNEYGNLTITHSTLNNNNAERGGAICNYGNLTITHSTLKNNNASYYGGAIQNYDGNLTVYNSTLNNNNAGRGGAICNYFNCILSVTNSTLNNNNASLTGGAIFNEGGYLSVANSTLNNNNAGRGGAIYDTSFHDSDKVHMEYYYDIVASSNFTQNHANDCGGAIYSDVYLNVDGNNFIENTAGNKETIDFGSWGWKLGLFNGNHYYSTDINLSVIKLSVKEDRDSFQYGENVELVFNLQPTNGDNYKDFSEGINDTTLYINGEKKVIGKYEAYNLTQLKPGKYNVNFTSCNSRSNTVTFNVICDSEIKTDKESYDYYEDVKNTVQMDITDESGMPGTADISVKDGDEYIELLRCHNVRDGSTIQTATLAEALTKLYGELDSSYNLSVTYYNDCANPSSTEFKLNIIRQRNTTITYDIINNTEGNVQINITVIDAVNRQIIKDANIKITGDINKNTTSGVIKDATLTSGDHTINVQYKESENYKASNITIDFNVEIDKDRKISQLEDTITGLTKQLNDANNQIRDLSNTANNLKEQLINFNKEINSLKEIIKELTRPPLNTTININPIRSSVGSTVKLTANIVDENRNKVTGGRVIFKVNGITLKDKNNNVIYAAVNNGTASINYKVQSVWIKNTTYLEAVYSGTTNFTSSRTKQSNILSIAKGKANIALEKARITSKAGETITLKAKVTDASGDRIDNDNVVFKLNGITLKDRNGNPIKVRVIDGEAKLDYIIPATYGAKAYTLTAVFGGNYYQRTETQGTLKLEKQAVTIDNNKITTKNNKITIKAIITDETGKPLMKSTPLAIKVNGVTVLKGVNSTNGKIDVSFNLALTPGLYELLIISGENSLYQTGKMTTVLKI